MNGRLGTVVVMLVLAAGGVRAATNAIDTAEAYENWTDGATGGVTDFGPWILQTTSTNVGENGHFIGTSAQNGPGTNTVPDVDIDTGGKSWGMYANSGQTASAVRPFVGGPLQVGQAFSCAMDTGYADLGSTIGFALQNAQSENVLEVYFRGGQTNYEVNAASGPQEVFFGYTTDGVVVRVALTSYTTFEGTISIYPDGSPVAFSGELMNPPNGPLITQARLFVFNAGGGSDHDQFFNTLEVTAPPPSEEAPAPSLLGLAVTNGEFVVSWSATNTVLYDLQTSTSLVDGAWSGVAGASNLVSFSSALSYTNAASTPIFYRVLQRDS